MIGTKTQTCEITILNKDGTKAVPKTPAATPTDQGTNQTTEQNINQTTGQNTDLWDGYPVKEVDGLYEPSAVGSYRKYWYGEVGSSYIYVLAEGNHMAPGDGLLVGVHSNVSGLTVAGAGSVSARLLTAEEVADLPDWATHYAYIMNVHANQAGNGTAVLTGSVGGQEIRCVMPIFVDRTD